MDIVQRVQVLIGGDASQAKKVIKEVEGELKASQARQRSTAATTGAQTGDAYGRAYNRAQDRWLKVAEDGFRKYGGTVGGILGDILGQFDKIGKAREATDVLRRAGRGAGGGVAGEAAGEFGGTLLGQAGATAVGAGVGANIGKLSAGAKGFISKATPYASELGNVLFTSNREKKVADFIARKLKAQTQFTDMFLAGEASFRDLFDDGGRNMSLFPEYLKAKLIAGASRTSAGQKMFLPSVAGLGKPEASGIGSLLTAGKVGLGLSAKPAIALTAGITSAVLALRTLSKSFDELNEKQNLVAKNKSIIDTINSIGNSAERSAEIIKRFGEEGQTAFNKLIQENRTLEQELRDNKGLMTYGAQAKLVFDGIADRISLIREGIADMTGAQSFKTGFWSGLKELIGSNLNNLQTKAQTFGPVMGILKRFGFEGASTQDAEDIIAGNKAVAEGEEALIQKRKKLFEINKERKQFEEKLKDLQEDEKPLIDQIKNVQTDIKNIMVEKNRLSKDSVEYKKLENKQLAEQIKLTELFNKKKADDVKAKEDAKEAARDESARRTAIINEQANARLNAATLMERSGMTAEAFSGNTQALPFTSPSSFSPAGKTVYNRAWENAQRLKQNALNAKAAQLSKQVKSIDEIYNEQGFLTVKAKNSK